MHGRMHTQTEVMYPAETKPNEKRSVSVPEGESRIPWSRTNIGEKFITIKTGRCLSQ